MAASVRSNKSARYKAKRKAKLNRKIRRVMGGGLKKKTERRHSTWS